MAIQDARGLLDTSVVIDLETLDPAVLPEAIAISSVTLAELEAGVHAAKDTSERAVRLDRLQRTEAAFRPISFDAAAARAFGRVVAAIVAAGRKPRRRFADLEIAATALAHNLPLYTRNPVDFVGLEDLIALRSV
ncbi:MAG: type II toxin-antitoxin system VapC family toxin [Mobiluncus sp.]|uniref:Ribonuclease VapC n=1 Tax=Mobiluncus porci TaxID=2652278 RepID=A0A7K0K1U4_9ACTO|nr:MULTISPECIES: type II toxin-antitoxin system VapC family toxin [Mobiluncus]MCI6584237.1 type II toxin-antitoxin system VapC family toxin [Mobiluncus sp.]MST49389.1 type II toxin-antitoxin system VapC family toxin [Mobiluncus porci]